MAWRLAENEKIYSGFERFRLFYFLHRSQSIKNQDRVPKESDVPFPAIVHHMEPYYSNLST